MEIFTSTETIVLDTGWPTKHDRSKTTLKLSLILEFICDIQPSLACMIIETINTNFCCAVNIIGDIKNIG